MSGCRRSAPLACPRPGSRAVFAGPSPCEPLAGSWLLGPHPALPCSPEQLPWAWSPAPPWGHHRASSHSWWPAATCHRQPYTWVYGMGPSLLGDGSDRCGPESDTGQVQPRSRAPPSWWVPGPEPRAWAVSHFTLSLKTNTYLDFTREDLRPREDRVNSCTVAAALPGSLRMPAAGASCHRAGPR